MKTAAEMTKKRTKPLTKSEISEAHGEVHKALAWLPDYSSKDEIIAALRAHADKLQAKLTRLEKEQQR